MKNKNIGEEIPMYIFLILFLCLKETVNEELFQILECWV
jgi:hypothetical protein